MKDTKVKKRKGVRPGRRTANRHRPGPDELARIALDLFAERHFASVTIKDIGRAANVNSAMIYYYYQDKEHLFRAAIESAIDEAFDPFATHCNSEVHEDPAETILAWFDTHVVLYKQLRNVDGALARSIFLKDFQMVETVEEFKRSIMLYLGYSPLKAKPPPLKARRR
jgi:AcrR family transcriptional regulator